MARIALRARDGSVRAYALVDDGLFDWLNQWRWHLHSKGYAARTECVDWRSVPQKTATYSMHRQIMGFPPSQVDHHNRDKLDNHRENLRRADGHEQQQNRDVQSNSRSGVRGVGLCRGMWRARVKVGGRSHFLGLFPRSEDAEAAVRAFRACHMPFSEDAES